MSPPAIPQTVTLSVRPQGAADEEWVEWLQQLAFGPGRYARAAFRVRERCPPDPHLSLISEIDGQPVSSLWMTPISLTGRNGYLLGPLATDPAHRNKGAGKLLVREASRRALEIDAGGFVLLVGDEPYYGPLGFVRTKPGAIRFPGPVDPRRILVHSNDPADADSLHGEIEPCGSSGKPG